MESIEFKAKFSRNQQKKAKKKKSVSIGAVFVRGRQIKMGNKFAALDEDDIARSARSRRSRTSSLVKLLSSLTSQTLRRP